jgi:hypothetical protein
VRPEDFFVFMTSNGVETTRDFANRSNIIRIRKKPPGFAFRKYQEGSLLDHVNANQAYYLGCIFGVIRAWHEAGKPMTDDTRHDFRQWVQVVDWIVQRQFRLTPLMEGHIEAQERVSSAGMVLLRAVVLALVRQEQIGNAQTATEIAQLCEAESIHIPGVRFGGELDGMARIVGSRLGRAFGKEDSLQIEGYRIERSVIQKKLESGNGHIDCKVYTVHNGAPQLNG